MGAAKGTKPWNAGIGSGWRDSHGYRQVRVDGRKVRQHRLIVEQFLGRPLRANEDIHHRDGDKLNNALDNLQLIDHGAHASHSNQTRTYRRGYQMVLRPAERRRRADAMKAYHRRKADGRTA